MASGNTPDFSQFNAVPDPQSLPADAAAADPGFVAPVADTSSPADPAAATTKPADAKPAKPKPPKPPFSVYTLMLILTLLFLIVGTVLLVTEMRAYNWEIQPNKPLF